MLIEEILNCNLVPIKDKKNPFYGISHENMKNILNCYYTGKLSVKKIIEKFDLSIKNVSKFASYLPSYYRSEKCLYDDSQMVTQLPSKSSLQTPTTDLICEKCGHTEYSRLKTSKKCNCDNCILKEVEEINRIKNVIYRIYEGSSVELSDISIYDRITLAAVLQISGAEFGYLIPPFKQYATSRTNVKLDMIQNLCNKRILRVSEQNPVNVFSDVSDESFSYSSQNVWLSINIDAGNIDNKKELFLELKYPEAFKNVSTKDYIDLWRKYISEELLKLFAFEMQRLRFDRELNDFKKIEKIFDAIGRWLETYTPSQIYCILYTSIRKANDARTTGNMGYYRFNEIAFIVKLADQMILKYETEGWPIQHYNFPDQLEIDMQTKIFFSKIAKTPNWFDTKIPKWDQLSFEDIDEKFGIIKNYSEYIQDVEINEIDTNFYTVIENAIYFHLFPYGLVIFDGNIEWLFGTTKDLYEYFQLLKESGQIKRLEEDIESTISSATKFYVERSYSSFAIYQAINIMVGAEIPQKRNYS